MREEVIWEGESSDVRCTGGRTGKDFLDVVSCCGFHDSRKRVLRFMLHDGVVFVKFVPILDFFVYIYVVMLDVDANE